MRGKTSIIKKLFVIQLFTVFLLTLSAEPYRVYPILFVHGINSGSGTWGAPVANREISDSIPADSVMDKSTYKHFLYYMTPYLWEWYNWEKTQGLTITYTPSDDPAQIPEKEIRDRYPNKTFLEVINFDDNRGSIDPDPSYPNFNDQGDELWNRIKEVIHVRARGKIRMKYNRERTLP